MIERYREITAEGLKRVVEKTRTFLCDPLGFNQRLSRIKESLDDFAIEANARLDDVNARLDDVNARLDDFAIEANAAIDGLEAEKKAELADHDPTPPKDDAPPQEIKAYKELVRQQTMTPTPPDQRAK